MTIEIPTVPWEEFAQRRGINGEGPAVTTDPKIPAPADWQGRPVPERRWIVDRLIPYRNVTMKSGDGGVGKSLITLQLLASSALRTSWLGRAVMPCRALGVFCEDDEEELHRRLHQICEHHGAQLGDLGNLRLMCRVGLDSVMMNFDGQSAGEVTDFYNQVLNHARDFGARIVVLDSLHDLFSGNENSRPQALELRREVLGPTHPQTLASLNNLAGLYQSQAATARPNPS